MMPRAVVAVARRRRFRNVALRNIRSGGLLGIETKFLDITIAATPITAPTDASGGEIQPTAGCTGCLSAPAQGDGAQQREGKKIVIKSILVQGAVTLTGQSGIAALNPEVFPTVYLALVQDSQTNAQTINSEDVFANIAGVGQNAPMPFRNMSNTSRFKVLATKVITPRQFFSLASNDAQVTTVSTAGVTVPYKLSANMKMPVNFTTTSTLANVNTVTDNSIHMVAYCSSVSMGPTVAGGCRIRFVG